MNERERERVIVQDREKEGEREERKGREREEESECVRDEGRERVERSEVWERERDNGESISTQAQKHGSTSTVEDEEKREVRVNSVGDMIKMNDWLWVWMRVMMRVWFEADMKYVERRNRREWEDVVIDCWGDNKKKVLVNRMIIAKNRVEEMEKSMRGEWMSASHVFKDNNNRVNSNMVEFIWFIDLKRSNCSFSKRTIFESLPTRAECMEWMNNYFHIYFSSPVWDENECLRVRQEFESGIQMLTPPIQLEKCSMEMENKLYNEQKFKSPFNLSALKALAKQVKNQDLANKVIDRIEKGHDPQFAAPGADVRYQNWATPYDDELAESFARKTMKTYVDKNFASGPFGGRPPFPNSQNEAQPTVHKSFTIPKDKTEPVCPEMKRRFIVHASWPYMSSYNFHLPRQNTNREMHTSAKFLANVARAGKDALVMMMDMIDCFMNFALPVKDWHRQCVQIGEDFWVFKVGMFGSRVAGDFAENFMALITDIFREVFGMKNVGVYVDNFDNVVVAIGGKPDWEAAKREWKMFLCLAKQIGIPVHDFVEPTLTWGARNEKGIEVDGHLGWGGTTTPIPMVWLTQKRISKLERAVANWEQSDKFSCKDLASMAGVFQSFAIVLKFGSLQRFLQKLFSLKANCERRVREEKGLRRSTKFFKFTFLNRAVRGIMSYLEKRQWKIPLIDWKKCEQDRELIVYADAAIPKELGITYAEGVWGKGAFTIGGRGMNKFFISEKHNKESIIRARRQKALSSPLLEFENYIQSVVTFVEATDSKKVHLLGDCQIAIEWIELGNPKDKCARELLEWLWDKQIELGFVMRVSWLKRDDNMIVIADKLSRNDTSSLSQLSGLGFARVRPRQLPY